MSREWSWFPFPQLEDDPRFVRLSSQATALLLVLSLIYARSGQDWSGEPKLLVGRFRFNGLRVKRALEELRTSGLWSEVKAFLDERVRRAGSVSLSNPRSQIRNPKSEVREQQAQASERLKRIDEVHDMQWRPEIEKELEALPPKQRAEWEEKARQQLVAREPKAKSWKPEVLREAIVPLLIEQFCQVKPEYEFGRWLSKNYPKLAKEDRNEP